MTNLAKIKLKSHLTILKKFPQSGTYRTTRGSYAIIYPLTKNET